MRFRAILLLSALVCTIDAQTPPDWLFLRSGAKIQGTFEGGTSQMIHFRSADGTKKDYSRQDIAWINLGISQGTQSTAGSNPSQGVSGGANPASMASCMQGPTADVPANTGSGVPVTQARLTLEFHNCARREVGTPPLVWSPELAARAQNWADHLATQENCHLVHTSNNPYGENLFGGSGGNWTALDAAQDWYSEKKQYHYAVLNQNNWYATGHYTQMIWKNTRAVGMGQAACRRGGIVIAAEYDPPGNYMGEAPY
jgi:pathogenesis-related protein 1